MIDMRGRSEAALLALLLGCQRVPGPDDDDSGGGDSEVEIGPAGIELVRLPAGSFVMGSPESEHGRHPDEGRHEVVLTRDFYAGRTEVTQGQFEELLGRNPAGFTACGADCPVERVLWAEAAAFTVAMSQAAGLAPCYECTGEGALVECSASGDPYACDGYRLPTEAEWEYAARSAGQVAGAYPSGGDLAFAADVEDCGGGLVLSDGTTLDEQAWYCGNSGETTHEVGLLDANASGLLDMSGNVWEYAHDWYGPYPDGPATDPSGPPDGVQRIKRGGPWKKFPLDLRMAERFPFDPAETVDTMGFRVARSAQ